MTWMRDEGRSTDDGNDDDDDDDDDSIVPSRPCRSFAQGASWRPLGAVLEPSSKLGRPLGALLGLSWALCEASWTPLERVGSRLGAILEPSGGEGGVLECAVYSLAQGV